MKASWCIGLAVLAGLLAFAIVTFGQQTPSCTIFVQPGESIQAAIDGAQDGAVICLGKGTWQENIKITKSLTLQGEGAEKTVIRAAEEGAAVSIEGEGIRVTVEGLGVNGAHGGSTYDEMAGWGWGKRSAQDFGCGIWIEGSAQVSLKDCSISKNNYGIMLMDSTRATITSCTATENREELCFPNFYLCIDRCPEVIHNPFEPSTWAACGLGIVLSDQSTATITDTIVAHNELHGIVLVDSAQATITRCSLSENDLGSGINLSGSSHATIDNSQLSGNNAGVLLWGDSQAAITNCTIAENGYGVSMVGNAEAIIRENLIYNNKVAGISSWYHSIPRGQGNRMWNNGVDLVGNLTSKLRLPLVEATEQEISYPDPRYPTLQHAVDALVPGGRLVVEGDTDVGGITIGKPLTIVAASGTKPIMQAPNPDSNGVISLVDHAAVVLQGMTLNGGRCGVIAGGSVQTTIIGGDISESSYGILLGNSAQVNVADSAIHGNSYGIVVWNTAKSVLKDCTISRNKEDGIVLGDSAEAMLQSCTISKSGRDGIVLGDNSCATLENSTVSENDSYGIAAEMKAQLSIRNSAFSGNHDDNIMLWDYSQAVISASTICRSNSAGVKLKDSTRVAITNCVINKNGGDGINAIGSEVTISASTISENAKSGIVLLATEATVEENKIIGNDEYGVAMDLKSCGFKYGGGTFFGYVAGKQNIIPTVGEPDGNKKGAVCPNELDFLMTDEGGELDRRK